MFEEIRILRTLRRKEDHYVDEKKIEKICNKFRVSLEKHKNNLIFKEQEDKTSKIQNISFNNKLNNFLYRRLNRRLVFNRF